MRPSEPIARSRVKRYYFAKIGPDQIQTTDEALGAQLLAAVKRVVIATVEPAPNKPGKYYLKSLDVPEVARAESDGDATLDDELDQLP